MCTVLQQTLMSMSSKKATLLTQQVWTALRTPRPLTIKLLDPDYLADEKWTKQMRDYFVVVDKNKNGFWSQEDWGIWIDNLKKKVSMGAREEAKLREVHAKFGAKLGATPGVQVTQDQFVTAVAEFSANKKENIALVNEVNQAWFDVVDTNDDGTISLSEYTKILEACNMTADVAKMVFDSIDANNNGKIEMDELLAVSHKFWFSLEPVLEKSAP